MCYRCTIVVGTCVSDGRLGQGHLGDRRDWETLQTLTQGRVVMHPVEKFCRHTPRRLIVSHPTDLLLARASVYQTENTLWVPHSDIRPGVSQPIVPGEPTSLLWGEQLGFQRRCSQAIISLPRDFVSAWPKLAGGIDARGICLACGILARNKGLNPTTFVCNLQTKRTFGAFEQNSVFWPSKDSAQPLPRRMRTVIFRPWPRLRHRRDGACPPAHRRVRRGRGRLARRPARTPRLRAQQRGICTRCRP
jgi:hypothetical protein